MSKSAEKVAANEDLLTQILLSLPVKSLFRFKCVSTRWLALISSHYFSKKHAQNNPNPSNSGLLLHNYPLLTCISLSENRHSGQGFGPVSVFEFLKIVPEWNHLSFMGSCNGLLLCFLISPCWTNIDTIYAVCNPTTKQLSRLPALENRATKPIVNIDLAFDPRDSPNFKVVCVRQCNPPVGPDYEIEIFSSETGSWKTCRGPFLSFRSGMLFRGGVYWKGRVYYLDLEDDDSMYFDIEGETVKSLRMPPVRDGAGPAAKRSWFMRESGGYLHLMDVQMNVNRGSSIKIYELKEDGSAWVTRHRIELSALRSTLPELVQYMDAWRTLEGTPGNHRGFGVGKYNICSILGLVRTEGGGVELIFSVPGRIGCYNPATAAWRVAAYFEHDRDRRGYNWHNVVQYAHSLSPI